MKPFFSLVLLCVDDLKCEEGPSFYSLRMVSLLRYFRKHYMQLPPLALNAPQRKVGLGGARGGAAHPGLHAWPLPLACGLLGGPGPLSEVWMHFASILLECAFWFVNFVEFSYLCLQNMYIPKLMENVSCKP
jgi:hypothetical protein